MTSTDLKGHLIARKGNLTQAGQQTTARLLQLKQQLRATHAELSALTGACQEIDRTLALIDQSDAPAMPMPADGRPPA